MTINPAQAAPGETVTIDGAGFGSLSAGSSVLFSEIPASVVSWTDNQIKVQVPLTAPGNSKVRVVSTGMSSDEIPFPVILRLDLKGKSDRVVDCTQESGETPQLTTFTVRVTSPYQGSLTYKWSDRGLHLDDTADTIMLNTTGCPYESTGCSACGLFDWTVSVQVQDSLSRQGSAAIGWGGAF